jgi:hypothetical protein
MGFRNQTNTERWKQPEQFQASWAERGKLLMKLFMDNEYGADASYSLAEIGCGPHAPISSICAGIGNIRTQKYDLTKWDEQTRVLDLNSKGQDLPEADVCVLSGVLEYVNDVAAVLSDLSRANRYLLFSYAFVPVDATRTDAGYVKEIQRRSTKLGWRNHLTLPELVRIGSRLGVISGISTWESSQVLLLIRRAES